MLSARHLPLLFLALGAFLPAVIYSEAAPPADGLPFFTTNPGNATVAPGQTATFTVEAQTLAPSLRYQWRHHGTNIVGETNSSLVITDVQEVHAGPYSVLAMTDAGAVPSLTAWLNLSNAGVRVQLSIGPIRASGGGLLGTNYRAELWAGPSPHQLAQIGAPVAAFAPGYFSGGGRTVTTVTPPNPVYCQVRFRLATNEPFLSNLWPYPPREDHIPILLTNLIVPMFAEWPDPWIRVERPDVYAPVNSDFRLTLKAMSFVYLSTIRYQWHKDGLAIGPPLLVTNSPYSYETNLTLILTNLQPDDAASYTVVASNFYGFQVSEPLQLSVVTRFAYDPPTISVAPGQTVPVGTTITFSALVDGPVEEMYWYRGGNWGIVGSEPIYAVENANPSTANNLTLYVKYPGSPGTLNVQPPWVNVVPHLVMAAPSVAGNGNLSFRILSGTLSTQIEVQASQDLTNWIPVTTLTATGGVANYVQPSGSPLTNRFFRAVGTP